MLTLDQIIAEIRTIAAESPYFIYTPPEGEAACLYVHTDPVTDEVIEGEGCIVGQALVRLGVDADQLGGTLTADSVLRDLEKEGLLTTAPTGADESKLSWIRNVQCHQDSGVAWREAVEQADTEALMPA